MTQRHERLIKALASVCLLSIAGAILVAGNSVASGYELSIYAGTPFLFWLLLLVGILGGIWLVVSQAFGGSRIDHVGIVIVPLGLANLTLLLLPALRGYYLYASHDSLVHMGLGFDITLTAHTNTSYVYPTIHVLVSELSQICGIDPVTVSWPDSAW